MRIRNLLVTHKGRTVLGVLISSWKCASRHTWERQSPTSCLSSASQPSSWTPVPWPSCHHPPPWLRDVSGVQCGIRSERDTYIPPFQRHLRSWPLLQVLETVSIRPCSKSHETSNIPSSTASISTSASRSGLGWAMSSWSLADRRSFRAASMGPKTFFLSLRLLALIWLDLALLAMVAVLEENSAGG